MTSAAVPKPSRQVLANRQYHRKAAACAAAPPPAAEKALSGGLLAKEKVQEASAVAGCSLLILFGVTLVGLAARSVLLSSWTRPQSFSMSRADQWVLEQNGGRAGYFIDIGATHHSNLSNTRLLEQHGWKGVCVDPDTRLFEARECGWVPRPITAHGGERVDLPACRNQSCLESKVTSLGIDYLLGLLEPPAVIDYISISARSQGLQILKGFPWDKHCVRIWTIEHANEDEQRSALWETFGAKGCRMADGIGDFWAACSCGGGPAASTAPAAGRPGSKGSARSQLAPDVAGQM